MIATQESTVLRPWDGRTWTVLHTLSRAEKALRRRADRLGIPMYLPLVARRSRRRDRARTIDVPMFPGYVFAALEPGDWAGARRTRYVANILSVADEAELLADLSNIELALAAGRRPEPCDYLRAGRRVRVVSGPLAGVEGRIDRRKKNGTLTLSVDFILRSVELTIDETQVEPAD